MDRVIAIVSDMIFATRITGTAEKVGAACRIVNDLSGLQDALQSNEPGTVLVDMDCDGISPEEAIRVAKHSCKRADDIAVRVDRLQAPSPFRPNLFQAGPEQSEVQGTWSPGPGKATCRCPQSTTRMNERSVRPPWRT